MQHTCDYTVTTCTLQTTSLYSKAYCIYIYNTVYCLGELYFQHGVAIHHLSNGQMLRASVTRITSFIVRIGAIAHASCCASLCTQGNIYNMKGETSSRSRSAMLEIQCAFISGITDTVTMFFLCSILNFQHRVIYPTTVHNII